jgi:tetratricopeptide (TPR) repeat protein
MYFTNLKCAKSGKREFHMSRRFVLITLVILLAVCPCYASGTDAIGNTFVTEYTYTIGENESQLEAQDKAEAQAKRIAIEEAGVYLESYSEVKNNVLTKDEVNTLASGVIQTTLLDKKLMLDGTTLKIYVKLQSIVDTSNLVAKMNDRKATEENVKLVDVNNNLQAKVDDDKLKARIQQEREVSLDILRAGLATLDTLGRESSYKLAKSNASLFPECDTAWWVLGRFSDLTGRYTESIYDYAQSIKHGSGTSSYLVYDYMGDVCIRAGNYHDALAYYKTTVNLALTQRKGSVTECFPTIMTSIALLEGLNADGVGTPKYLADIEELKVLAK